jgi:prolipoprotein diacylglyceryltransferase
LYLLGGYGVGRLALESCRERAHAAGWFTAQHGISAALVAVGVVGIVIGWLR